MVPVVVVSVLCLRPPHLCPRVRPRRPRSSKHVHLQQPDRAALRLLGSHPRAAVQGRLQQPRARARLVPDPRQGVRREPPRSHPQSAARPALRCEAAPRAGAATAAPTMASAGRRGRDRRSGAPPRWRCFVSSRAGVLLRRGGVRTGGPSTDPGPAGPRGLGGPVCFFFAKGAWGNVTEALSGPAAMLRRPCARGSCRPQCVRMPGAACLRVAPPSVRAAAGVRVLAGVPLRPVFLLWCRFRVGGAPWSAYRAPPPQSPLPDPSPQSPPPPSCPSLKPGLTSTCQRALWCPPPPRFAATVPRRRRGGRAGPLVLSGAQCRASVRWAAVPRPAHRHDTAFHLGCVHGLGRPQHCSGTGRGGAVCEAVMRRCGPTGRRAGHGGPCFGAEMHVARGAAPP